MFTGLVEEVGLIQDIINRADGKSFVIGCDLILSDMAVGDSIAVNGACQTVEEFSPGSFSIFSIPETLAATNFNQLVAGSRVNLERAMKASDRIGGHLVQGHVENTAPVGQLLKKENHVDLRIDMSSPFLVPKGSVTIDGISLTIQRVEEEGFWVQIIPETLKKTHLSWLSTGNLVNIETDYIVRALDYAQQWRKKHE